MISAIVTDIEGTTSALSFVKEVLFPYAAMQLPQYVKEHQHETAVSQELAATAQLSGLAKEDSSGLIEQLQQWISADEKITPLKNLQGMIWEFGYASRAFEAHIYEDAERCLRRWFEQGIALYVYSSGSIHAQKLFFQYSEAGDLRPLFKDHFDTTTGPKSDSESYRKILRAVGIPAPQVLFLSDVEAELDAAREAGLHTARLVREADYGAGPAQVSSNHPTFASFDEIELRQLP